VRVRERMTSLEVLFMVVADLRSAELNNSGLSRSRRAGECVTAGERIEAAWARSQVSKFLT
jgi:hypothetical protein